VRRGSVGRRCTSGLAAEPFHLPHRRVERIHVLGSAPPSAARAHVDLGAARAGGGSSPPPASTTRGRGRPGRRCGSGPRGRRGSSPCSLQRAMKCIPSGARRPSRAAPARSSPEGRLAAAKAISHRLDRCPLLTATSCTVSDPAPPGAGRADRSARARGSRLPPRHPQPGAGEELAGSRQRGRPRSRSCVDPFDEGARQPCTAYAPALSSPSPTRPANAAPHRRGR